MIYLVVGVDRRTLAPWHVNVQARDVATAKLTALTHAEAAGIRLAVAAVIGANSSVVTDPAEASAPWGKVA